MKRTCILLVKQDVELIQTGFDRFTVRYFKQVKPGLTYAAAAKEFGRCVMHALACEGNLDNRDRAEAAADGDKMPVFRTD